MDQNNLCLTSIILISIIFSGAYRNVQFSIGLCIMIIARAVVLEWISEAANLNTDLTLIEYSKLAIIFILGKIHYILTPIIYSRILLGLHCFYLF
jgi:hypothetical protein